MVAVRKYGFGYFAPSLRKEHTVKHPCGFYQDETHSPLPHVDFKAIDNTNEDDYGRKCRAVHTDKGWLLYLGSGKSYIPTDQAPFPTLEKLQAWANAQHRFGQLY